MPQKRTLPVCVKCKLDKAYKVIPEDYDPEKASEYMRKVLNYLSDPDDTINDAYNTKRLNLLKEEYFGIKEDYTEQKKYFNDLLLSLEDDITAKVFADDNYFETAIKYALTANYIDYGMFSEIKGETIMELFSKINEREVDEIEMENLKKDIINGKTILYCTDNCGEIVLDKIVIKAIKKLNPNIDITVVVRGIPVLNDATLEDAKYVGMDKLVKVIDNGTDIMGTDDNYVNEITKIKLKTSDLIISKGMANFETLIHRGYNTYFIFMIKCKVFSKQFNKPLLSSMLINDSRVPETLIGWKS